MFYHPGKDLRLVVHGDDFTQIGRKEQLDWFRTHIRNRLEVTFRARLGPSEEEDKAVRILNRIVEWADDGIKYEADQRHAEILINEFGLQATKGVDTPASPDHRI